MSSKNMSCSLLLLLSFFSPFHFRAIVRSRTNIHCSNNHGETNNAVVLITICSVFIVTHVPRLILAVQVTKVVLIQTVASVMYSTSLDGLVDDWARVSCL